MVQTCPWQESGTGLEIAVFLQMSLNQPHSNQLGKKQTQSARGCSAGKERRLPLLRGSLRKECSYVSFYNLFVLFHPWKSQPRHKPETISKTNGNTRNGSTLGCELFNGITRTSVQQQGTSLAIVTIFLALFFFRQPHNYKSRDQVAFDKCNASKVYKS